MLVGAFGISSWNVALSVVKVLPFNVCSSSSLKTFFSILLSCILLTNLTFYFFKGEKPTFLVFLFIWLSSMKVECHWNPSVKSHWTGSVALMILMSSTQIIRSRQSSRLLTLSGANWLPVKPLIPTANAQIIYIYLMQSCGCMPKTVHS